MPRDVCSGCSAPAPEVKTAGTLANHGWRIVVPQGPDATRQAVQWLCPKCSAQRTGSAPLSTNRPKG